MTTNIFTYGTLYKRDNSGGVRKWIAEVGDTPDGWGWRTVSGLVDGKMVTSSWKLVVAKNVGRANETNCEEQAGFEAEAERTKKKDKGYFVDVKDIDTFTKFKPMLAYEFSKMKSINFPVMAQPKLDGIRCIARADGLWTRAGKELVSVPHVAKDLIEFFSANPDVVLDGELYNHTLRDDFNKLSSLIRKTKPTNADIKESEEKVQYWVYDCYTDADVFFGQNTIALQSNRALVNAKSVVTVTSIFVEDKENLDALYGKWLEEGYEGQMVRKIDSKYETGKRSKNLLKRKEFLDTEFKVLAVEEGVGNWAGYIKRFVLQLPDGREFGSNVRGNQATLKALLESGVTPEWATCRYFTPTPDGIPRFPVVTDYGQGKRND